MARATPELDLIAAANQLLEFDGWRPIKMEAIGKPEWGKGTGEPGQPDYLYLRYNPGNSLNMAPAVGEIMWIEWKALKRGAKPHQLLWHDTERKRGAFTAIVNQDFAADIDSFWLWYKASGLCRRVRRMDLEEKRVT